MYVLPRTAPPHPRASARYGGAGPADEIAVYQSGHIHPGDRAGMVPQGESRIYFEEIQETLRIGASLEVQLCHAAQPKPAHQLAPQRLDVGDVSDFDRGAVPVGQ